MTFSNSPALRLSIVSGLFWGALAYVFGLHQLKPGIWAGMLAAPFIGMLMGTVSRSFSRRSLPAKLLISLAVLYGAAMLLAVATGVSGAIATLTLDPGAASVRTYLIGPLFVVPWGLTAGPVLLMWPLAYFNLSLVSESWRSGVPEPA